MAIVIQCRILLLALQGRHVHADPQLEEEGMRLEGKPFLSSRNPGPPSFFVGWLLEKQEVPPWLPSPGPLPFPAAKLSDKEREQVSGRGRPLSRMANGGTACPAPLVHAECKAPPASTAPGGLSLSHRQTLVRHTQRLRWDLPLQAASAHAHSPGP